MPQEDARQCHAGSTPAAGAMNDQPTTERDHLVNLAALLIELEQVLVAQRAILHGVLDALIDGDVHEPA